MSRKAEAIDDIGTYDSVKEYYGQVLQKTADLKTDACCCPNSLPAYIKGVLSLIADEIKDKYYGCGSPIPLCLEGLSVLDLGCGTGRDCYVMSKLVGETGRVAGIDMTANQIAVACKYLDAQTQSFGYAEPNASFIFDYIENLSDHFEHESADVVTSNCVINLTEDKERVLQSVYDVLRFGGEMYFADIYADRRLPRRLYDDPLLRGECLGGALYWRDFERAARRAGFVDPRIVSARPLAVENEDIRTRVGNIRFYAITYRLWKIAGLEDACEDYGHTAVYLGGIAESPNEFALDNGHVFEKNRPERICGNTALMLSQTRFKDYFEVSGSFKEHFGSFTDCGATGRDKQSGPSDCC